MRRPTLEGAVARTVGIGQGLDRVVLARSGDAFFADGHLHTTAKWLIVARHMTRPDHTLFAG